MISVLSRRNSMALLSLYDLEAFAGLSVSLQTELATTSANVDEDNKIILQANTTPSKSILEHLSNELLIDIFEFLLPYDLHRSVYNLNLRLNTICEVQKLHLNLSLAKRAFDYYCSNQQPFASQIYSLKLDDNYDRLTLFNQYIDIDYFINLRMVTIREPSSENLDKILSKLHTLSHLSYLNIYLALMQSSSITVAIFKIRLLKQLILYSTDSIILHFDDPSIIPLTELEYLEVDGCYTMDFLELLKYVGPNVRRMKIRINYHREQNSASIDPMIIDELLSNHRMPVLLRRLEMKFNFLLLNNLHLILRLFPHLTYLTFSTLTNELNFISSPIWHEFISTSLLELKQLQYYIEIKGLLGNVVQCPPTDLIDSLYSMNREWLVGPLVMDYNSLLIAPTLELYTYPQPVRGSKYSLELYDKKRYITTTVSSALINIDKNITYLRITLNDDQQTTTTTDQLSVFETNATYPKVTQIIIHSQMTRSAIQNDKKISLMISDLIKSIPDLCKITSLSFTFDSSIASIYPSTTLARRLLDKMPKINRLDLPYEYLLRLLKSPLIVKILTKKIESLTIQFDNGPPILPDMIRILNVFKINLHFLYFVVRINFPANKFYFILPPLFSGICKKLYKFQLRLRTGTLQQPPIFDEQFKSRLKSCLTAQAERSKAKSGTMEYRIKDNEFSISF